jgi:hypothetical protein
MGLDRLGSAGRRLILKIMPDFFVFFFCWGATRKIASGTIYELSHPVFYPIIE